MIRIKIEPMWRFTKCHPTATVVDLAIRFVNRDPEAEAGSLFDQLLKQHGIAGDQSRGYGRIELTHAAVAACVASEMADVAFGMEAASIV